MDAGAARGRDGRAGATADEDDEAMGAEAAVEIVSIGGSGWLRAEKGAAAAEEEGEDMAGRCSSGTLSATRGAATSVEAIPSVSGEEKRGGAAHQETTFPRASGEMAWALYIWSRTLCT